MNTQIDDETLMAYADGELDALQIKRVEQAIQADAGVAARAAQHRALRTKLQSDLNDVLAEPVPQRLLDTLHTPIAATRSVAELARARHSRTTQHRNWRSREWMAMAASLIAGIVIGVYALNFTSKQFISEQGGALIAQGRLDEALTTQLAGAGEVASIKLGISFRNRDGEYCRSFSLHEGRPIAGLACRQADRWRVQILSETGNDSSEFRQAGSAIPAPVLAFIEQQISGEPLDADAEVTAQRSGWK